MKKAIRYFLVAATIVSMVLMFTMGACKKEAEPVEEVAEEEAVEVTTEAPEVVAEEEGMVSFGAKQFEPEGGLAFAFTSISTQVAFWVPVNMGIADFAAQYGVKAEHLGPADYKPEEEVAVLENLLEAGIDGVTIFIPEPGIMDGVIAEYQKSGIPVIIQQTGWQDAERLGLAYIGQNNLIAGSGWGDKIIEVLGGAEGAKGKHVLFITEAPGQSSLEERMQGAKEKLDEVGITYDTLDVTTDREKAYGIIEAAYTANPDIDAIMSTDTTGTPAAGLFVKNENLVGEVIVGGFDLNPDTMIGIKEGYIEFTIDQYPYRAGYLGMVMLWQKVVMGMEPFTHYIPAGFVDKTNVDVAMELSEKGYR